MAQVGLLHLHSPAFMLADITTDVDWEAKIIKNALRYIRDPFFFSPKKKEVRKYVKNLDVSVN